MVPTACVDVSTTKFYFSELFLVARFSRKFKKHSEKVPMEDFILCNTIISQASKMYRTVLYNIAQFKKIVLYMRTN
jgi:hypothetical protein